MFLDRLPERGGFVARKALGGLRKRVEDPDGRGESGQVAEIPGEQARVELIRAGREQDIPRPLDLRPGLKARALLGPSAPGGRVVLSDEQVAERAAQGRLDQRVVDAKLAVAVPQERL